MTFTLVRLAVPERSVDEVLGLFACDALGARSDERGDGTIEVRLYFDSPAAGRDVLERARAWLARTRLASGLPGPELSAIEDEPWVERFQAGLAPFDLGNRFRVLPHPDAPSSAGERITLHLTPGRAFGTGEHATTALCVELLEQSVRPGSRWLDLGCGTGILGLAAACLGAADVEALDDDPDAVAVARRVLARNGAAAQRVRVSCGSLDAVAHRRFDGIAANLALPFFLDHASALADRLEPGGLLIASGFLEPDAPSAADALAAAGLVLRPARVRAEWSALLAARRRGS